MTHFLHFPSSSFSILTEIIIGILPPFSFLIVFHSYRGDPWRIFCLPFPFSLSSICTEVTRRMLSMFYFSLSSVLTNITRGRLSSSPFSLSSFLKGQSNEIFYSRFFIKQLILVSVDMPKSDFGSTLHG